MNFSNISIAPDSMVPLHTQLYNQIRHLILSGQWEPGRRLPSELELQENLGISRSTIRQAMKSIEAEGLIVRVAGRGSFVRSFFVEKNKSRVLGYVTPEFANNFQYQLFRGAESAARAKNYRLLFCLSNKTVNEENNLLDELMADRVSGVLIYPALGGGKHRRLYQLSSQSLTPIVLMDRMIEGVNFDFVSTDNFRGAYDGVKYLISLGHKNILFITNPIMSLFPIAERLRGYQQAMLDAGLTPQEPFQVGQENQEMWWDYAVDNFRAEYKKEIEQIGTMLRSDKKPTAIFSMNQVIAMLVLKAAQNERMNIPGDFSVLCFDEFEMSYLVQVPLTCVTQYSYYMGRRAAELLIERIEGHEGPQRKELIPAQLQVRSSTGIPPDQNS